MLHRRLSRWLFVALCALPAVLVAQARPAPRTIEDRTAGTPVTTVHSNPRATLSGNLGSDAVASFVSKLSFEGEIVDSVTGERLSALSDHRLGVKREATATTTWASIRSATNEGAGRLWQRFMTARGQ